MVKSHDNLITWMTIIIIIKNINNIILESLVTALNDGHEFAEKDACRAYPSRARCCQ
jgi:hypothetical protein